MKIVGEIFRFELHKKIKIDETTKIIKDAEFEKTVNDFEDKLVLDYQQRLIENIAYKQLFELDKISEDKLALSWVFLELSSDVYNYLIDNEDKTQDNECAAKIFYNMILHFRCLFTLWLSKQQENMFAPLRTMYELYITLRFIEKYPELSKPFIDHIAMKNANIKRKLNKKYALNEHENDIIAKYGQDFSDEYGWTAEILSNKRKRNLRGMADNLKLEGYRPLYVLTSESIHASSLSINSYFNIYSDPLIMIHSAVELLTNGLLSMARNFKVGYEKYLLLMNIIYALREDLLDEEQQET
ncbi:MAG: DUF5677 domain-containing protein [Eubacteriales bacterium]